ncbi:MAG: segregation/condensation protein A [Acidobacteriota bacterium]
MPLQFKIEKFEGPLDLLLQMVEQEHLEITEVSLASVTDQYIEYLEHYPVSKEELADFLVVAARLLLIKSRVLLPQVSFADEEGFSLEDQLKMYKQFAEAAKRLEAQIKLRRFTFLREKPPIQPGVFYPPKNLTAARLAEVFHEIIRAIEPVTRLAQAAVERVVSIKEKISELLALLERGRASFRAFVRSAKDRTELVVSFLALLELVKQRRAGVEQEELFQDIVITPIKS